MKNPETPKVAIVHDWLVGGGAERVVLELHRMYPDAPIYTSYCTPQWREQLDGKVITGWLQHFGKLRKFMVLGRIWWFTHLDFSEYDLVISTCGNGEAKSIRTDYRASRVSQWLTGLGASENRKGAVQEGTVTAARSSQQRHVSQSAGKRGGFADEIASTVRKPVHVCYCHTPTHYYWRHYNQYIKHPGFGVFDPLARLGLRLLVAPLRAWDLRASERPDYYMANSRHIARDIKTYYDRDAVAVHPPVDVERFAPAVSTGQKRQGFVTMSRQVPAKRMDIAIEACSRLGLPLKVIGRGPDHDRLVKLAGPTVQFLTDVSDADMPAQLASAEAFLFCAFEDFGVAPVEAMAAGTPVLAYKAGGALDYVVPGVSGEFFPKQTADSLAALLIKFDSKKYDAATVSAQAQQFSDVAFQKSIRAFLKPLGF